MIRVRVPLILLLLLSCFPLSILAVVEEESDQKEIILEKEEILHYQLSSIDEALIDEVRLNLLMDSLEQQLSKSPIDATFGKSFEIIEGEPGIALDRYEFKIRFLEAFYELDDVQLEVPGKSVPPRVDAGLLLEISKKKLGSYATHYKNTNKERTNNIVLSAEAINGTVIFPGESFSFNETVGERTKERGYQRAPVIVRGEFLEDIGGGICQVSSTLFNAVDLRGIQMIERYAHSRSVPYVPPGRDATVSWWGPDFVFKNLYNEPIVIMAGAANGKVSVEIFSSETAEYFNGD